jgi:hypothetical protein
MKRMHTLFIALMLGAAAAAGLLAATRTVDIGRAASPAQPSAQALAARAAKLDRMQHALQKALAKRPPKLPKVPHRQRALAGMRSQSAQGGVVYVRPPATVTSPSSYEDNDSFEDEHEVGDD